MGDWGDAGNQEGPKEGGFRSRNWSLFPPYNDPHSFPILFFPLEHYYKTALTEAFSKALRGEQEK